jgi:hypothetical protein
VSEQSQSEAEHGPYIRAVGRGIEARDIAVSAVEIGLYGDDEFRWARMTLSPDASEFAGPVVAEATAEWDEESGWSIVLPGGATGHGVLKGQSVLPEPDDVAAWVVVTLTHPELSLSYEDDFWVRPMAEDEFQARLARYAARS